MYLQICIQIGLFAYLFVSVMLLSLVLPSAFVTGIFIIVLASVNLSLSHVSLLKHI